MCCPTIREDLLHKATNLKIVPTLDRVVTRVLSILEDTNSCFTDLCDVVKYDYGFSSKVISIANSAYYSRGIEIFSLQRAMISIGFDEVRNIITCFLFIDNVLKKLKLNEEDILSLWKHSVRVAFAAKILSEKTLTEDPQKAYTVALFHDIGKIIFYAGTDCYREVAKEANTNGNEIAKLEREKFGTDHQEIGYAISVKWRFPEEFTQVIRYHHDADKSTKYGSLVKLVRAADRFSTSPDCELGAQGFILSKEKDRLDKEVQKIMELLHLA